jgi:hypothetical protein
VLGIASGEEQERPRNDIFTVIKDVIHYLPALRFCERTINPKTTTPMMIKITRQMQTNAMVNAINGVWDVAGGSAETVNDEVGTAYGVGVTASGAPETGT